MTEEKRISEEIKQEEKKYPHEEESNIDHDVMSSIVNNTSQCMGITYTTLKHKTLQEIDKEEHEQYGDFEKEQIIDFWTFQLIMTGILNVVGGYIFQTHKAEIGCHIPSVVEYQLQRYKQLEGEYPINSVEMYLVKTEEVKE